MKILFAIVVILLSLFGGALGFQMWRFCKTRPSEEILEHAKKFKLKLSILIWLFCIVTIISIVLIITGTSTETYQTSDPNEYLEMEGHITNEGMDISSGLFIFPETIEKLKNVEYEYFCKRGILDNSYMVFMKGDYPDMNSYEAELERLSNIGCSIETSEGTVNNKVEYSEISFDYPAYITIYNTNMAFEYALVDDANKSVVYIYLKLCEGADFLPDKYLPIEFKGKSMMEYGTDWKNQNIYYAPDGEGVYVHYLD